MEMDTLGHGVSRKGDPDEGDKRDVTDGGTKQKALLFSSYPYIRID
jgi:hypothetical protein